MENSLINQSDAGKFGNALKFDGENDGLAFPKSHSTYQTNSRFHYGSLGIPTSMEP